MIVLSLLLYGATPAPVPADRDAFQWWAEIWLPGLIGVASIVTAVAALWISHRATLLAQAVEAQRVAAEDSRALREEQERLRVTAVSEARTLTRWANLATRDHHWQYRERAKVGREAHGPSLLEDARVLLMQSLVPGASELFELTELEISALRSWVPDAMYMPDRVMHRHAPEHATSALLDRVVEYRRERIVSRIRRWALNPEAARSEVVADLGRARSDPDAFWDYRLGLGVDGLKQLSELDSPPSMMAERIEFFRERGLLPEEPIAGADGLESDAGDVR